MAQIGVKPLPAAPETVPQRRPAARRVAAGAPARRHEGRFDIEYFGDSILGLVEGGDQRQLHRLQRGDIHIEIQLDLHGHSEVAARKRVEESVDHAYSYGKRCLLVIHGRGHRSAGAPVLKHALPDWLTGPRCAARVLAFCSAPAELGGAGATLVLLRRRR